MRLVWVTVSTAEAEAAVERHREQVRKLAAEGRLRVAGEFHERAGFLEVFEAGDRREAEAITRASSLVEEGLGSWLLREWIDARPQTSSVAGTGGSTQRP